MRTAFIDTLTELAQKDERVWLLTGDLGFSVFENFRDRFPDRYLNVGVAEQDLIGIGAGLALAGKRPFVYSITTFASMRAYEQIRIDVAYQNLSVVIVGGGSTFSYSTFGGTHMPLEDFALMRVMPGMTVLSPGDPIEVRKLLKDAYSRGCPAYMRIAKKGEPVVHQREEDVELGRIAVLRTGSDVCIFSTGRQLPSACRAADSLQEKGVSVGVYSVHTLKPLDITLIKRVCKDAKACVVVEEHSTVGGLSDAVARVLFEAKISISYKALCVADEFPKGVYSQDAFLAQYDLTTDGIVQAACDMLLK